ncbi:YpmS family protein [Alkalicoccobacillus gibsonii]|uniref:YpmS family protein n=1 Tax=Alkalicoccobacillus gibsonii TaxID=79881 RepID=UPI0019317D3D|nr:YpmS family protein [Alkalicoccobacillus gibsonii]MBM0064116.1 YpmS family protein [Alkalicoccobacillus gibsonii]
MIKNKWKVAFVVLAVIVVIAVITLFISLRSILPEAEEVPYTESERTNEQGLVEIRSTKAQLNELILEATSEFQEETPYTVELLSDTVKFQSTFRLLGQSIPVTINFDPEVAANGDLLLHADSLSFGFLTIPSEQAMQLMKSHTELPDWIVVHPSDSLIEVQLTNAHFDDLYSFRVIDFDLARDEIQVEMFINRD